MEAAMMPAMTKTELRNFAWVMTGAFAVFGLFGLYRGGETIPLGLLGIATLFLLSGLIAPTLLGPVHKLWMRFAHILGWINTRVILGLFFYLILTPVSTVMKIGRRDILKRRFDRTNPSYWHPHGPMKDAKKSYEHLY